MLCLQQGMFVNMELLKKASLPSIEDYAKQLAVRKNLTAELGRSIRCLQEENLDKCVVADSDECANTLCSVIEAIFIHGLKDKFTSKVSSVFGSNNDKIPEPEFWTYVSKYCHKNVVLEIKNLSQISNDVGRCRAWLRISLNDGLIVSYIGAMLSDKTSLQRFYCTTAYLRDDEQADIMKKLLEGTTVFRFELSCNNSILNTWNCLPLTLANVWTPPATPQPVMPAVDVIDFFTDQKSHGKGSSKNDSSSAKNKDTAPVEDNNMPKTSVSEEISIPSKSELEVSDPQSKENNEVTSGSCEVNNEFSNIQSKELDTTNKILASDNSENEETSSKLSSSDSVPDFGVEVVNDPTEMVHGSYGNKLNEKSGWSSVFDDERDQRDNEASQSYDSLLQSYNKNLSKVVIGTPELADTFSAIMGKPEDEYIVITLISIYGEL